jgi:hypothetical protein
MGSHLNHSLPLGEGWGEAKHKTHWILLEIDADCNAPSATRNESEQSSFLLEWSAKAIQAIMIGRSRP